MDFQGFQNSYPTLLIVFAVFLLAGISWWAYKDQKNIPIFSRIGLSALRALSLIILLFLLLNPFFYSSEEIEKEPGIAVFLDNSESIGIHKGEYNGLESYDQLLGFLAFEARDEAQFHFYSIGESSTEFSADSLNASAPQTNIADAVNTVLEFDEDIRAAIFITDGIITYGKNPVFSAASSTIPFYAIAIGDTSKVQDVSVSNVITNNTGYTNTTQNVEVEIRQSGYRNSSVNVSLKTGNEILQQQEISFDTDDQVKSLNFELELDESGLQQFEVETNVLEGEWTRENNNSFFSVDVLDNKVKILHLAFEIHPDVKTIRNIINEDINNELTTLTWLGGSRFIEDVPDDFDFNLAIIHGAPNTDQVEGILESIETIPTIYLSGPSVFIQNDSFLSGFTLISPQNAQLVKAVLNPLLRPNEHPVLEVPAINFMETPPLSAPLRTNLQQAASASLYGITYNNVKLDDPVIAVYEQGNIRRAHIFIWDWYKLQLSQNQQHREFLRQLFSNIISWTSSDPEDQKLQVKPARQSFSTFENPVITATLKNESGENEDDAIIELEVTSEDGTTSTFNMQNTGSGIYNLELPRSAEGLYDFEATARKGNRIIDEKTGEFLVANSSSELSDTHRNDELLKALSDNSGGIFFTYDNLNGFWDSLSVSGLLEPQTQSVERYAYPVRSAVWFIVVLALLSSEWLLRKYYSLS